MADDERIITREDNSNAATRTWADKTPAEILDDISRFAHHTEPLPVEFYLPQHVYDQAIAAGIELGPAVHPISAYTSLEDD